MQIYPRIIDWSHRCMSKTTHTRQRIKDIRTYPYESKIYGFLWNLNPNLKKVNYHVNVALTMCNKAFHFNCFVFRQLLQVDTT